MITYIRKFCVKSYFFIITQNRTGSDYIIRNFINRHENDTQKSKIKGKNKRFSKIIVAGVSLDNR